LHRRRIERHNQRAGNGGEFPAQPLNNRSRRMHITLRSSNGRRFAKRIAWLDAAPEKLNPTIVKMPLISGSREITSSAFPQISRVYESDAPCGAWTITSSSPDHPRE